MKRFTTKEELEQIIVYSDNTGIFYAEDKNKAMEYAKKLRVERPNEKVVYKEIWTRAKYKIW